MMRRSTLFVPEKNENNIPQNRRSTITAAYLPKMETYGLTGISKMTENAQRTIIVFIFIIENIK